MVIIRNKFKRLIPEKSFQPLITTDSFTIGRDDSKRLYVIQGMAYSNNIYSLDKDNIRYFREICEASGLDVFKVKEVNYIFNLGDTFERHEFKLLEYLSEHYDHVLSDYDLSQFEFCTNGDVLVDSVTIPTRLSYYDVLNSH